jgi:putative membrane protein
MSATFWKISFQFMLLSVALITGDWIFDSVRIDSNISALITAGVIMILHRFVKPLLIILTIPATLFTFGFFILIVNALMLILASYIVPAFEIQGFWSAFWLAIFLSIVQLVFGADNRTQFKYHKSQNTNDDIFDDYEEIQ